MRTFHGAWPALVTPFTKDNTIHVSVLKELVEYLVNQHVGGFYVCGSTGQGLFLSVEERKLVAETVLNQVQGRVPVIIHVGCMALPDVIELAQHAGQAGADGISSILPPLYRDTSSLYGYFEAIAIAAADLPLLTYIFGGPINAAELMRALMKIPSVAGTKYTGSNMYEFRQIVELRANNWTVFSGMDEQCLFAAMMGSSGNIGSTLNYIPGVYRRIHELCAQGDLKQALALQLQANKTTEIMHAAGFAGALPEAMRMLGFDCGQPRLPGLPLSEEERQALRTALKAAGFLELTEVQD